MTDREILQRLLDASIEVTRCLGSEKGYLPQLGAPKTEDLIEAVRDAQAHLGDKRYMFHTRYGEVTKQQ